MARHLNIKLKLLFSMKNDRKAIINKINRENRANGMKKMSSF